jgi:hypothetical protein
VAPARASALAAAATLAALALTACSSSTPTPPDDAALSATLRAAGIEPTPDVATWRAAAQAAFCGGDEDTFRLTLAAPGQTPESLRKTRVVVEQLCPERVGLVDSRLAEPR